MVVPPELLLLAERQARTLSREQLLGHGVSDRVIQRLLRDGRLDRICQGVYATGEGGWMQQAWAGVLIGGPKAVIGGEAAGYLLGLVREKPCTFLNRVRSERVHAQASGAGAGAGAGVAAAALRAAWRSAFFAARFSRQVSRTS